MKIHLNPKISRQLITWSTWRERACQEFLSLLSLSVRGLSHSGGTRRRKACPTGWPDKPDQKEHARREREGRGVHLVCMRGESQKNPTNTPKTHAHPHTRGLEQRCTWSTALLRLALITAPRASQLLQPYQHPRGSRALPCCQSCRSGGCRAAEDGWIFLQTSFFFFSLLWSKIWCTAQNNQ